MPHCLTVVSLELKFQPQYKKMKCITLQLTLQLKNYQLFRAKTVTTIKQTFAYEFRKQNPKRQINYYLKKYNI